MYPMSLHVMSNIAHTTPLPNRMGSAKRTQLLEEKDDIL